MTRSLALLHGFTGSASFWDAVRGELPEGVAVFAPRLVGHGDPADAGVETFDAEVERLARALRERGSGWCLGGYSLGARVALGLLVRHPDLFASAVLFGVQPGLESDAERAERARADEALSELLVERGIVAFVDRWESIPLFASQSALPQEILAAQRAARLGHDPRELARSLRATGLAGMPSYWEQLSSIRARVRLVAGELDAKFRRIGERMEPLIPGATLTVVPGAGHNVVLERPGACAELLARACRPE